MASAGELSDALRRVAAGMPPGALTNALTCLEAAQLRLHQVLAGSCQSAATEVQGLLDQAVYAVREAQRFGLSARVAIESLAGKIGDGSRTSDREPLLAVGARAGDGSSRVDAPPVLPSCGQGLVDAGLLADVQRRGLKITPEKVVRIGRDQAGRVVWLEKGDERAGLAHIVSDKRVVEFRDAGVRGADIVDVVFRAVTKGRPVGATGRDRTVFSLTHRGQEIRIAVSVGNNGFIVGASPISTKRKLKPLS